MHTPLLSSPSLEHPPQSSRVPFRPHTPSLCPSTTLRQGGATGLSKRERESRRDGRTFPIAPPSLSDSPLDVYSPPQALQGGGEKKGGGVPPLSSPPCLALFSSAFTPLQAFCIASSRIQPLRLLLFHITHPLKPGYNRQTPQQRPFCSAAVGDAGSVVHRGGPSPGRRRKGQDTTPPPSLERERESAAPLPYLFHQVGPPTV